MEMKTIENETLGVACGNWSMDEVISLPVESGWEIHCGVTIKWDVYPYEAPSLWISPVAAAGMAMLIGYVYSFHRNKIRKRHILFNKP